MQTQQQDTNLQFRTVVTGYRFHGTLQRPSQQSQFHIPTFFLTIQSSSNKQQSYHLSINKQFLQNHNLIKQFPTPQSLYEHLSKMTKTKIKLAINNQKNEKIIFVIVQKDNKVMSQLPIDLNRIGQHLNNQEQTNNNKIMHCPIKPKVVMEQQIVYQNYQKVSETPVYEKQYSQIQQNNQQAPQPKISHCQIKPQIFFQQQIVYQNYQKVSQTPVYDKYGNLQTPQKQPQNDLQTNISTPTISVPTIHQDQKPVSQIPSQPQKFQPIDFIAKLQQLRQKRQLEKAQEKPKRQRKQLTYYQFEIKQNQSQNLYDFSFQNNLQSLLDFIEKQQLHKTQEIVLSNLFIKKIIYIERAKLQQMPPFNQLKFDSLKSLSLEENKISAINNLETCNNLQKLNLDGNQLTSIQNLGHLTTLKILKLGNNQISVIGGLGSLKNLQSLWLDFNNIQKIENLNELKSLKSLNLSFNMIKKLQNLDQLANLQQLLINENQISKIQNLDNLLKLTRLSLNMNSIQKITGVKKLLLLEVLSLFQNKIQQFDKYAFQEVNWLKMLKQFKIGGNQIDWNQQALSYIDRLKKYGIKVLM